MNEMKSYATPFAIVGATLTAALLVVLNFLITPGVLWSIYPVFALVWWPVGVYLCHRKKYMAFSVAGSLLTIAFLAAVNIITSPQTLWFLYAVPPLLCWPVAMHYKNNLILFPVAALLSVLIVAYFVVINLLLTPGRVWAIYPVYLALWWPLGLYFTGRNDYKRLSVAGAVMTIAFLIASNLLETAYPWALYACFPVIWWPLAMYLGKRLRGFKFSIICSVCMLAWYGALNILLAPGSPWVIFIAFGLAWWVLSVNFYGRHCPHIYAIVMSAVSIAFFAAVNIIFSPGALWAIYPAFALLWWPMTRLFAEKKAWRGYPLAAGALTITFLVAVNIITSPSFPWSAFPILGLLWWPLAVGLAGRRKTLAFSVCGALLAIATLVAINLITSPSFLWSVFVALAVLWWPSAVFFTKKKGAFGFSLTGSLLVIALLAAINLMTSPSFPWFIFAVFAVLWWPLSVYFYHVRRRRLSDQKA
jgi:hypothetical protein